MTIYRHAVDSVVMYHVLFQCIPFPRARKGGISYLSSVNVRKTWRLLRLGLNLCGAFLGSGGSPFAYPRMTFPVWYLSTVPSFTSIIRKSQEEFVNKEFWRYKIPLMYEKHVVFSCPGWNSCALSSVAGVHLPHTPL